MFPDGEQNVPSGNVCTGTDVALGAAAGATVAAEVGVPTVLQVGWAAVLALQADSASPTARPSTEMLAIVVVCVKYCKLIIIFPYRRYIGRKSIRLRRYPVVVFEFFAQLDRKSVV